MVLVVLGGGVEVLRTVQDALKDDRPVVVLPECGYAAEDIHEMCYGNLPEGAMPNSFKPPIAGKPPGGTPSPDLFFCQVGCFASCSL